MSKRPLTYISCLGIAFLSAVFPLSQRLASAPRVILSAGKNLSSKNGNSVRTVEFSYSVSLKNIPSNSKRLSLWLPVAKSDYLQEVLDFKVSADRPYSFYSDPDYGNSILHLEASGELPASLVLNLRFLVRRRAYHLSDRVGENLITPSEDYLARFLSPDRLVPIDGRIRQEALEVATDARTPLGKAWGDLRPPNAHCSL